MTETQQTLVLGAGCFWCTEAVYVQVRGVVDVESGYCNGTVALDHDHPSAVPAPTYAQVCTGSSGYAEVVKLVFDTAQVSVRELLEIFFLIHDPTSLNRQGADVGSQYRSGIYFTTPEQAAVARALLAEMQASGVYAKPLVTEILPLAHYAAAEDYHQDFFARNPEQAYCMAVAAPKVEKFRKTFARLQKN